MYDESKMNQPKFGCNSFEFDLLHTHVIKFWQVDQKHSCISARRQRLVCQYNVFEYQDKLHAKLEMKNVIKSKKEEKMARFAYICLLLSAEGKFN